MQKRWSVFLIHLNCNDKKIINKLYQELKEYVDISLMKESIELNGKVLEFLEQIMSLSPYALEYKLDLDVVTLFKSYEVRVESVYETLLERIIEYIKVMRQVCNVNIFVFVDLKHYLSKFEIKQLYECVFYEKVYLIILEPVQSVHIDCEKHWILDKDFCIIECK